MSAGERCSVKRCSGRAGAPESCPGKLWPRDAHLQQQRVAGLGVDGLLHARGVGAQQVVAHDLGQALLGEGGVGGPVILVEGVLRRKRGRQAGRVGERRGRTAGGRPASTRAASSWSNTRAVAGQPRRSNPQPRSTHLDRDDGVLLAQLGVEGGHLLAALLEGAVVVLGLEGQVVLALLLVCAKGGKRGVAAVGCWLEARRGRRGRLGGPGRPPLAAAACRPAAGALRPDRAKQGCAPARWAHTVAAATRAAIACCAAPGAGSRHADRARPCTHCRTQRRRSPWRS